MISEAKSHIGSLLVNINRICNSVNCKARYGEGMNRLRVKCVKCGKEWGKASAIPWGPDDISSSLCNSCFREVISPIIHKKQLKEGNFDCFGKGATDCDQLECKYRQWCLRMEESEEAPTKDDEDRLAVATACH